MTSFDAGEESANSRFWFWVNGVEQMAHRPLLGVGYGGFPDLNDGMTAHNSFVLCFAETGLIGYFFWMGCIYYCFKRRAESAVARHEGETGGEADAGGESLLGARLALAGFLVAAFWISRTYVPVLYLLFSLPAAQLSAFAGPAGGIPEGGTGRDGGRIALLCLGSILFIYLFALQLR
jgi:putative inorganic carbon (HCO3(-)) transporter